MAIIKFNYIPRGRFAKAIARKTLGYNSDKKKEAQRVLFGHDGELTSEQALQMIDAAAKNVYFFRSILSPDPNGENKDRNLDLRKLTKDMVAFLEERLQREIPFIAAKHTNTKTPHIHAILLIERRGRKKMITQEILDDLYKEMGVKAVKQREQREQFRKHVRQRKALHRFLKTDRDVPVSSGIRLFFDVPLCPKCKSAPLVKRNGTEGYICLICGYTPQHSRFYERESEGAECSR